MVKVEITKQGYVVHYCYIIATLSYFFVAD